MDSSHSVRAPLAPGEPCSWGAQLQCTLSPALGIAMMLLYACVGVYFILYGLHLWRAWVQLKAAQYQKYRMANLALRVQVGAFPF